MKGLWEADIEFVATYNARHFPHVWYCKGPSVLEQVQQGESRR